MNIYNKGLLKLVLLPQKLYTNMGVDLHQLECILTTKMVMDDRRPSSLQATRKTKKEKSVNSATLATMLISAVLGCVFLMSFMFGRNIVPQLTIYFSYFIFMLASSLISDFTSVLIDVRDNYIILPKPVNDRTVLLARLLHIFVHICKLVVPMSLPGLVYIIYNYKITGGLLFFILIMLSVVFTIFLINAVYVLILKVTTPQKFQAIISYIQIVFAIFLYASYQLLPRLLGRFEGLDIYLSNNPWILLAPPYWFASAFGVLHNLHGLATEYIATVLAFVLPPLSLWVVIKYMAPSFNKKLSLISGSGTDTTTVTNVNATGKTAMNKKSTYAGTIAKWVTRAGPERMGFLFTWSMTARSKDFKMKVYPSIGYIVVYAFVMILNSRNLSIDQIKHQTGTGKIMIVSAIYMCSFLLFMAINQVTFSDKYKAAWIYYITPIATPGMVISGAVKAAILKFIIPLTFIIGILGLSFIGPVFIPNLILGLFNELLIAALVVYIGFKELPFSKLQTTASKTGGFMRGLMRGLLPFALGIIHYMVYDITPVIIILAILSIIATWLVMGSIKMVTWNAIKTAYSEE